MKPWTRALTYAACLVSITSFPACLDVETTNKVNTDGSIVRTMMFEDDSAIIYRGNLPIPMDSSWQKSIQKVEKDKFRLTASRRFQNVDEMNDALRGAFGKTLQFTFGFHRSFQWFFTSYRFTETDLKYIQYDSIPLTDFLSSAEIEAFEHHEVEKIPYATKGDSLAILSAEERAKEWESRNAFEPVFAAFLDGVKELHDPGLTPVDIASQKDTLYKSSRASLELGNVDTLQLIFARILKNPLVHKVWNLKAKSFHDIGEKRNLNFISGSLVSNVIMPGLITGSNAQSIEGNKATWRDYKDYARILGYTMWVESRQVNWWAVILTGLLVVALATLLTVSSFRKRRFL